MSQANASARKRRAPAEIPASVNTQQQPFQSQPQPSGLTLPQVILLVDKRLTALEKNATNPVENNIGLSDEIEHKFTLKLSEIVDEFNARYSLLAEELSNTKTLLLNLQSYTMDINKKLLENYVISKGNNLTDFSEKTIIEQEDETEI
jgi:hypothetical protein